MNLILPANRLNELAEVDVNVLVSKVESEAISPGVSAFWTQFTTCDQVVNQCVSRLLKELLDSFFGRFSLAHFHASMNCSGIDAGTAALMRTHFELPGCCSKTSQSEGQAATGLNCFIFQPGGRYVTCGPMSYGTKHTGFTVLAFTVSTITAAATAINFLKNVLRSIVLLSMCLFFGYVSLVNAQINDDRFVLGIYTKAVRDVTELDKSKPPKIGVAYFGKDPGSDLEFAKNDVITHVNRDVVKSPDNLKEIIEGLDPEKKHKLIYQRFANGKWNKGEVAFKPKTHRQLVTDNMTMTTDKVLGRTYYRDKRSPSTPDENNVQCWIMEQDGKDHLFVRYAYYGSEWLFLQEAIVKLDDESVIVKFDDVKRENNSKVWEWCTREATATDHELLLRICLAKDVTIRFVGKQYKHDYELTGTDQLAIQNVCEAYRMRKKQ